MPSSPQLKKILLNICSSRRRNRGKHVAPKILRNRGQNIRIPYSNQKECGAVIMWAEEKPVCEKKIQFLTLLWVAKIGSVLLDQLQKWPLEEQNYGYNYACYFSYLWFVMLKTLFSLVKGMTVRQPETKMAPLAHWYFQALVTKLQYWIRWAQEMTRRMLH